MATAATDTEREQLAAIPASYFRAVDQYDLPAVLEHFAEDATLTVQSARVTFTGHDEIGRMFTDFFGDWDSMVHEITNIVVDPVARRSRPSSSSTSTATARRRCTTATSSMSDPTGGSAA